MGAADTLTEFGLYGSYDLAINKWIRGVMTAVEPSTVVIQSSPMRAFGDAAAMVAKGLIDPTKTLEGGDFNRAALIPLPLVSIQPGAPEARENQRIVPSKSLFRTSLPGTDPSQRERYIARPPLPLWITYTCEIWTKTRSTMNALITALQRQFDPYMAWGTVDIDNWFWGSVWMPIHLQGMVDNSELEAGDKDRLLRHTITFRVEAWCFFPPDKDLTVQKTTIERLVSHMENLLYIDDVHFPCIYMAVPSQHMYKVAATSGGKLNVIPVGAPPNPVTHYFGSKILVFRGNFILDQISFSNSTIINNWNYTFNGNIGRTGLTANRISAGPGLLPPLFVSQEQDLLIGGGGFFVQVILRDSLQLQFKPRFILDANVQPVAPALPYQTQTPG